MNISLLRPFSHEVTEGFRIGKDAGRIDEPPYNSPVSKEGGSLLNWSSHVPMKENDPLKPLPLETVSLAFF